MTNEEKEAVKSRWQMAVVAACQNAVACSVKLGVRDVLVGPGLQYGSTTVHLHEVI